MNLGEQNAIRKTDVKDRDLFDLLLVDSCRKTIERLYNDHQKMERKRKNLISCYQGDAYLSEWLNPRK